jgi:cytochrome c biogenesis protein ResB
MSINVASQRASKSLKSKNKSQAIGPFTVKQWMKTPSFWAIYAAAWYLAIYIEFGLVFGCISVLLLIHFNTSTPEERLHEKVTAKQEEYNALSRQAKRELARKAKKKGAPVSDQDEVDPENELSAYSVFNRNQQRLAGEFDYAAYEKGLREGRIA